MDDTNFGPDLSLTPSQEGLLRTALSSNAANGNPPKSATGASGLDRSHSSYEQQQKNGTMAVNTDIYTSSTQQTPVSGRLPSLDDSPFLEQFDDGNFVDDNFEWDNNGYQLFGDLPGTEFNDDGEHADKRKASSDEGADEEGSSKRREGDDKAKKAPQKPGRKPLTGEPTTKRKAQNRAAQRAFRERKERHLKDLETKVEDLEKASENANHENGRLRATVDKLQTELKEYRKRISLNASGAGYSPPQSATTQSRSYSNGGGDFSFAFPKFGDLPGSYLNNGSLVKTTSPIQNGQQSATSPPPKQSNDIRKTSSSSSKSVSPTNYFNPGMPATIPMPNQSPTNGFSSADTDGLSGLFSPSILEVASRSNSTDYMSFPVEPLSTNGTTTKDSFSSSINGQSVLPNVRHASSTSLTGSPGSSMSQALDSSCGTTPESSAESPDNRKGSESILNTINEEVNAPNPSGATPNLVKSPAVDINGFDWMAQQNGGQFDPVLFGDYRDPQDNILNNFDYFNDAFPLNDFSTPYNMADLANGPQKKDFMKEIEVQRNGSPKSMTPGNENGQCLGMNHLWDRIQHSDKAQGGEAEMDDLCSQLKSKAKCSGKGAIIHQNDVDEILGPAPVEQKDVLKMFSS